MSYATINGLSLYYEEHGASSADPPLVLLHGGLHTIDLSFGRLLPTLAAKHRVIGVELQGHGHTADTDRPMTLDNLAGDVAALLSHLDVDQAALFGFSLGGLTALRVAMQYPDRVSRLVLAATHYRPDGYHREITDPSLWATSTRMPTAADFQEMSEAYRRVAPDPDHLEVLQHKASTMVAAFEGWSADEMRAVAAPTLIVIGDKDFVLVEHAAEMLELMPNAQLLVLPGTTHAQVPNRTDILVPALSHFL